MNRLLAEYWTLAGRPAPPVEIVADRDVLPSRLAASELAVGAVAAATTSAALLVQARGERPPHARVDGRRVSAAFRSDRLFRLDGRPIVGFAELSGFWRTRDGWVRTHANYPHHRQRLLTALGLPEGAGADDLRATLAEAGAHEVEATVQAAGGICVAVRGEAEWREHPQHAALRRLPLVSWDPLGDAPPRRLPPPPPPPLLPAAGLRVLDLTRVIAGPVATRTLALLGADVLRLDPPQLPEISWQHLDTGMGKRSALLDLGTQQDGFTDLLESADVVVVGYRPHAVDRFGLTPERLAERRPGLVVATLSAWGDTGPWGDHRGFDSIVQAATGIAAAEADESGRPGALPAQALDHATGYLVAAGVLTAVADQLVHGGSVHVRAHLARTGAWLLDHPDGTTRALPDVDDLLLERDTASGRLRYAPPAVELERGPGDWTVVGSPWATDPPRWLTSGG
jgi:crotonobetainyl-CoA:carnitine CoA-transferase CaiB-like acyl-CoA transferase